MSLRFPAPPSVRAPAPLSVRAPSLRAPITSFQQQTSSIEALVPGQVYVIENVFSSLNQPGKVPPAGLSEAQLIPFMQRALDDYAIAKEGAFASDSPRHLELLAAMAHLYVTRPKYIERAEMARAEKAEETARLALPNEFPDGTQEWVAREIELLSGPNSSNKETDDPAYLRMMATGLQQKIPELALATTVEQAEPLYANFLIQSDVFERGSNSELIAERFAHLLAVLYVSGLSNAPEGSDKWIADEAAVFGMTPAQLDEIIAPQVAGMIESGRFGPGTTVEAIEEFFQQMQVANEKEPSPPRLMRMMAFAVLRKLRAASVRASMRSVRPPPSIRPTSLRSMRPPSIRASMVPPPSVRASVLPPPSIRGSVLPPPQPTASMLASAVPWRATITSVSSSSSHPRPRLCAHCRSCMSIFPF